MGSHKSYMGSKRPSTGKGKWKLVFLNSSLILASCLFVYLLLEFFLFQMFLAYLPLKFYGYVPDALRILAQSSKDATFPQSYVALVGDSYAQGAGDWFEFANIYKNSDYHSAHVIHHQTGRDVVSFGRGGAGSILGIACGPIANYEYLKKTSLYKIRPPRDILVYFYEGNDLNDNLLSLRMFFKAKHDPRIDDEYFKKFISKDVLARDFMFTGKKDFTWYNNLFFIKFLRNILVNRYERVNADIFFHPGNVNKIMLGKEIYIVPNELPSPSLELTDDEINLGVYVFEQSLRYLQKYFPQSRIGIVYIPSPLSTYELVSDKVDIQTGSSEFVVHKMIDFKGP